MNKKLIAAAIAAGLAAPMSANAAPTVYGHLQAEISSEDRTLSTIDTDPTTAGLQGNVTDGRVVQGGGGRFQEDIGVDDNKRGRLGVKGSEDLGGGLKAIYKFEWQVDTTDGNPNDGSRESFVGLKGGFGQVELGRVKSPYKYYGGVKYDPFVTTEIEARRYGGMSTGDYGQNGFLSRTLAYQGKFGMVNIRATYAPSEQDGEDGDLGFGIKFGDKMWEAGFAWAHDEDTNNSTGTGATDESFDAMKIFGKVKFGNMAVRGQYEMLEEEQAGAAADQEGDIIFLGFDMKFGKTSLHIQAAEGTWEVSGSPDQESEYLAIGVVHKFSKKTRVFAGYGDMSVDNMNNTAGGANGDRDALTVGMRIDF